MSDPGSDPVDAAAAVQFEIELALEGVVDRLDQLPDRFEQVFAGSGCAVAIRGPQQHHAAVGEEGIEFAGDAALVSDDRELGPVAGESGVVVGHGHEDLAFVKLRVGQRPRDRKP